MLHGKRLINNEKKYKLKVQRINVPDLGSRDRNVVFVRRTSSSGKFRGVGNLEWGGNGEGMERGRSVYE